MAINNRDFRGDTRARETRVNERIRAREVRLIDEEGQMVGVMPSGQALSLARERGLDLVEVSPMASPPVCKLMDYGRFKYEQSKKENEARKHQKVSELKEIRLSPRTDDHDLAVKGRKIEEFLGEGDKVKVGIRFRGRELAHPEIGRRLLDKILEGLKGIAVVERPPIMEGKIMSMIVSRAPGWEPPKKAAPAVRSRKNSHGPATENGATENGATENGATENGASSDVVPAPAPVTEPEPEQPEL